MTSAARPTFLPAMGGHSLRDTRAGPISLQSAKDLPGQLTLKYRKIDQDREEMKLKLAEKERKYMEKVKGVQVLHSEQFKAIQDLSLDRDQESESEESEDESDEDDTAELMRELEKIKKERAEEELLKEQERKEQERKELEERAITGNPLLNDFSTSIGGVKRRWDDDVIFKNQARDEVEVKKRFINDMLRSDFHRKFMNKYVK